MRAVPFLLASLFLLGASTAPNSGGPPENAVTVAAPAHPTLPANAVPVLFAQDAQGLVAHAGTVAARFSPGGPRFTSPEGSWSLRFVGAAEAPASAGPSVGGVANWYLGNDPAQWRVGATLLGGVAYRSVWPGIDVHFHDGGQGIKYDVVVAPGADPAAARFAIEEASQLAVTPDGALQAMVGGGVLTQPAPLAYQEGSDGPTIVPSRFTLDGKAFGFVLGPHAHDRAVVIDPALDYGTYLAGSGTDVAWAVQVGSDGGIYVTGESQSPELYPQGTAGSRPPMEWTTDHNHEATNVFVAKVLADGSGYEWGSFIGGATTFEPDTAYALALGPGGLVYLTGYTHSWDFPANKTSFQPALRSLHPSGQLTVDRAHDFYDAFVAKVGPRGELQYASFLGGGGEDFGYAIDVDDRNGDVVVAGETTSLDFPTTVGAYQNAKEDDCGGDLQKDTWTFVTRFVGWGHSVADVGASTIMGAYAHVATYDLDLDASGRPWIVGYKYVSNCPAATPGAPNNVPNTNGTKNLFVTALEPALDRIHYTARLGGNGDDRAFGVKVVGGAAGAEPLVYVTGQSASSNLPVTDGSLPGGKEDVFALKLDPGRPAGQHVVYFTRLGGRDDDVGRAIEVDGQGRAYIAGHTGGSFYFAPQWKTTDGSNGTLVACQAQSARGQEAILAILEPDGRLRYSTYLGGRGNDAAEELALTPDGKVVLVGQTTSPNFPTTALPLGQALKGGKDAFIARLDPNAAPDCPATPTSLPDPCIAWRPPAAISVPFNPQDQPVTVPVRILNCGRTLNSADPMEPRHSLAWSFWAVQDGGGHGGTSGSGRTIPMTLSGSETTLYGEVNVNKCWNAVIGSSPPCYPGKYLLQWDILETSPADPFVPTTLFSRQGVAVGYTELTIAPL
ncbi:MAG TPA: SBBP repeat-containing protein [Candidatus Thermoplasmatota archaeon]|nr:SBBP repeat-containing protein [Candidatus Thermoplasmatota archaeon]